MASNDQPQAPATTQAVPVGVRVQPPAPRHEVEPTVPYAIVPGPGRDQLLFYHVQASARDINGLWDSCRFCVSNLVWVHDHFIVAPNPLYLNPSSAYEERFGKIVRVLLNWYAAKRVVLSLDWPAEPDA
jgi:hypothetical protein